MLFWKVPNRDEMRDEHFFFKANAALHILSAEQTRPKFCRSSPLSIGPQSFYQLIPVICLTTSQASNVSGASPSPPLDVCAKSAVRDKSV